MVGSRLWPGWWAVGCCAPLYDLERPDLSRSAFSGCPKRKRKKCKLPVISRRHLFIAKLTLARLLLLSTCPSLYLPTPPCPRIPPVQVSLDDSPGSPASPSRRYLYSQHADDTLSSMRQHALAASCWTASQVCV